MNGTLGSLPISATCKKHTCEQVNYVTVSPKHEGRKPELLLLICLNMADEGERRSGPREGRPGGHQDRFPGAPVQHRAGEGASRVLSVVRRPRPGQARGSTQRSGSSAPSSRSHTHQVVADVLHSLHHALHGLQHRQVNAHLRTQEKMRHVTRQVCALPSLGTCVPENAVTVSNCLNTVLSKLLKNDHVPVGTSGSRTAALQLEAPCTPKWTAVQQ